MEKLNYQNCDFWELNNETDNYNMFYYFKKVAKKLGANIDYCYVVYVNWIEWKNTFRKLPKYTNIKYTDADKLVWNWTYLARYGEYILVYEP